MIASWAAVIIAALVAFISFLQWMTAREKVVLDLFDKRFAVYDELRAAISGIVRHGTNQDDYFKFARAASRAKLLFGSEVFAYLEERRNDVSRAVVDLANPRTVSEDQRQRLEALMNRLSDFFKDFDALVIPYLQHSQRKLAFARVDEMNLAALNFRVGMLRIWIAFSAIWVIFWTWHLNVPCSLGTFNAPWCSTTNPYEGLPLIWWAYFRLGVKIFGVPILALILWFVTGWIAKGFNANSSR